MARTYLACSVLWFETCRCMYLSLVPTYGTQESPHQSNSYPSKLKVTLDLHSPILPFQLDLPRYLGQGLHGRPRGIVCS